MKEKIEVGFIAILMFSLFFFMLIMGGKEKLMDLQIADTLGRTTVVASK